MTAVTLTDLLDSLESGTPYVVPHAGTARQLRAAFNLIQRDRGRAAWDPPQVMSWRQWTIALWHSLTVNGSEQRLLLNSAQEHSLWCEILRQTERSSYVGSPDSLAEMAASAWRLAAEYRALDRLQDFDASHDARAFREWATQFSQRCDVGGYLSTALLDDALLHHARANSLLCPDALNLVGFPAKLPSQTALLQSFQDRGTKVTELRLTVAATSRTDPAMAVAESPQDEIELAARWMHESLLEPRSHVRRVALLVPNLRQERSDVEVTLRKVLAPELQWIGADLSSAPWEMATGTPLASTAMISDALAIARWSIEPLPMQRLSALLLSPYVGENRGAAEMLDSSARWDASVLRQLRLLNPELSMEAFVAAADSISDRRAIDSSRSSDVLAWVRNVYHVSRRAQRQRHQRSFADWMERVRDLLRAANWPGTRTLNATEVETVSSWEHLLDAISSLDFRGQRVTFAEALDTLASHANRTESFAPSTDAPVQVMDAAEADCFGFDRVAMVHCSDANLPATDRVNPLLPWHLQRTFGMPGTDPERTFQRGRAFVEDLINGSGSVLFLNALEDEHGSTSPSPLLQQLHVARKDADELVTSSQDSDAVAYEECSDSDTLPALASSHVGGGSSLLRSQSACGFLAFAEVRLRSRELLSPDLGFDAMDSGQLLHQTLHLFWKHVKTQAGLRHLTFAERQDQLHAAIDSALRDYAHVSGGWEGAYLTLQKERLCSLLQRWLDQELLRGPFEILDLERKQTLPIGPLEVDLRIDRMDRVDDGFVLVDYKTGYAASTKQWEGERPDDPQLPLYSLLYEADELKGLAFAKVRPGRSLQWVGYQSEHGILPKAEVRDIAQSMDGWHRVLTQLAEDFATGKAEVNPKDYNLNCVRCAQRLLCRVDPHRLKTDTNAEQEDVELADG